MTVRLPRPIWLTVFACVLLLTGTLGYTGSSGMVGVRGCPLLTPDERGEHTECFGRSRGIRSDEWAVDAPMERAQQLATPSFPVVNLNQGLGQLQRNSYGSPVLDWGAVFRPLLWPLFSGSRWGFGLRWFLRSFVVLVGFVGWFRAVTSRSDSSGADDGARAHLTALAALAVLYSSAVSWWMSTPIVEMIGFAGLGVAAARRSLLAEQRAIKAAWWVAACYLFTCAFFGFYPPTWAPLLWLVAASIIDCRWRDTHRGWRSLVGALPLLVALVVAVGAAIAYYSPYIVAVTHTAYPGARRATSGGTSLLRLLTMAWPSVGIVAPLDGPEVYLGKESTNVCEFSAVEVIPFFVLLATATVRGPIRLAVTRALTGNPWLVAAWLVLAAWQFLALPKAFGTLTLLQWSPVYRTWVVFGVGTALLAVAILVELLSAQPTPRGFARLEASVGALVCVLLFLLVRAEFGKVTGHPRLMLLAALVTVLGIALVRYRTGAWLIALGWVVPLVAANLGVNPLVSSRDLFVKGGGHRAVRAALEARPGRLLDYGTHAGAQLAGEGFATLGGVQVAPDTNLFHFLAQESPGITEHMYNRYAHVQFVTPPGTSQLIQADWIQVAVSPCSARLATLWVNHFLVGPGAALPAECAAAFEVRDVGESRLWSRKTPAGPVGVASTRAPRSALEFDFRAASAVKLTRQRAALLIEAPPGQRPFATAVNLSLVDRIECQGASAARLDAHVVVTPRGDGPVRCEVKFLGTAGALARLSRR